MKAIGKRFFDLLIKLISVKTIPAAISSAAFISSPGWITASVFMVSWALVVGIRYAEKVRALIGSATQKVSQ